MIQPETTRSIDVLGIGEAMGCVVPERAEPFALAERFAVTVAGAESNVAAHLAMAGRRSAWSGALGEDSLGRRALRWLAQHGVDASWAFIDTDAPTGLMLKDPGVGVDYFRAGSATSRLGPDFVARIPWAQVAIVHISGITPALSESCHQMVRSAIRAARAHATIVSFDVNYRSQLWTGRAADPSAVIAELAAESDVVFVGADEATALWGTTSSQQLRAQFPGVSHLVIKDGARVASEFSGEDEAVVPVPPADVVEVVGAGDAFAAGWLHAYLDDSPAAVRLSRGHEFAARTIATTQDVPALPTPEESSNT